MTNARSVMKAPKSSYVHPSAIVEGNVTIGEGCFVGARAILKGNIAIGDGSYVGEGSVLVGDITIGEHTAIQMNCAIRGVHTIGNYVHIYDLVNIESGRPPEESGDCSVVRDGAWINHGATMHGCEIGEGAVVGINAALDYHCKIGKGAIVTNGSACRLGTVVPDNCIFEGVPATVIKRNITDEDRRELLGLLPSEWVIRTADYIDELVKELVRAE